jgi:iron complex outermembrane recepter protein
MSHTILRTIAAGLLLGSAAAHAQDTKVADTTIKVMEMKEVTISSVKDAIETAPGKTILNVQSLAGSSGKNVLELLRRIPGVSVDGKGNISLTNRQGVLVTVNGRKTNLTGDDLSDYLKGMTAEEVAQIEVMSQPSAMYDAEGNAGVINIRTRKLRKAGFNGNLSLTDNISLFNSTNNTLLLNYRKKKTNWYTSLNYINGMNGVWWNQDTKFTDNTGAVIAGTKMYSEPVEWFDKYNVRIGADRNFSEATTAGFTATGAYYANVMNTPIQTATTLPGGDLVTSLRHTNENSLRKNAGANLYLRHTFSKQSDININLDYLLYTKRLFQHLETTADRNGIALVDQLTLKSFLPRNVAIYSARADHSTTFASGLKLESGLKQSLVDIDNAAYFSQYSAGKWAPDPSRTNQFLYKEYISAIYTNAVKKLSDKWEGQVGLRGELALINGLQVATGERIDRRLPAVFPTCYISYKPDSANALELNYGRRIERPDFTMLNPFNYYTFYNTYQRGNPLLLPQYNHNVQLKHSYKNQLTTVLDLNTSRDIIAYVSQPDNASGTTYGIPVNLGNSSAALLGLTYSNNKAPWCELMVNVSGMYALYNGILNSEPVENEGFGYRVWVNGRFPMGKWSADCYGMFASRMVASSVGWTGNNLYTNFGVSRKVFHDTTTVRVSIDDPFYVYRNNNDEMQPGLNNNSSLRSNSRYCTMAVSYNFGHNPDKRSARNVQLPDEAKRM